MALMMRRAPGQTVLIATFVACGLPLVLGATAARGKAGKPRQEQAAPQQKLSQAPPLAADQSWRGAARAGVFSGEKPGVPLAPLFAVKTGARIYAPPMPGRGGVVLVGAGDKVLYGVDGRSGAVRLRIELPDIVDAAVAVARDGTIYAGCDDKRLYALTPDGAIKWQVETGDRVAAPPLIGPDGTVYVGAQDDRIYAVTPAGQVDWTAKLGADADTGLALGEDGTLYAGSDDGRIYALSGKDKGKIRWQVNLGSPIRATPAAAGGGVYVGTSSGRLVALDGSGRQRFSVQTRGKILGGPAVAPDGTVYVGSGDRMFYAIDGAGSVRWTFRAGGPIRTAPVIDGDGRIWFGADDGRLYALQPDGAVAWLHIGGGKIASSPLLFGGGVYYGGDDGVIYGLGGPGGAGAGPGRPG
jgi:outer membrane protein assembly factor BamB